MIEWTPVAQRLGYDSEEAMWADLYDTKRLSVMKIAEQLGVSRNTIRLTLKKRTAPMRKRGGANRGTVELTPEIVDEIKVHGVMAVAKRLDVRYTTLYKRLRRMGFTVADLQKGESDNDGQRSA